MRARPKLTLHERRRRRARNERRGRNPEPAQHRIRGAHGARYFRFYGHVVRVYKGALEPVQLVGSPIDARPGRYPRAAVTLAPLPARYRREFRTHLEELELRDRAADSGIELPDKVEWGQADLRPQPTQVAA